ncbi:MAG: hypothetical protein EBS53_00745 [Bacteroidetes bacterium]|nr:hypothetical protein [Bacteroidota bacterium]
MINYAPNIKTILLDYLMESKPIDEFIISHEMPFESGSRRADIAVIQKHQMTAYEIKGPQDNLNRLDDQLNSYFRTFDFTYLVITPLYLASVVSKFPSKLGIIVINLDTRSLKIIRPAKRIKRLNKDSLSSLIGRKDILSIDFFKHRQQLSKLSLSQLREILVKQVNLQTIQTKALESYLDKYRNPFISFTRERGTRTTLDDLKNLVQR